MASDSSAWMAANAFSTTGSHLVKGNEVFGRVIGIQPIDDETVQAQIGQMRLLLPAGLDLPVGRRIFLARTDDHEYGVWILPEEEQELPAQTICPAGITFDEICREIERGNLIAFLKNRLGDRVDLSRVSLSSIAPPDAKRLGCPTTLQPLSPASLCRNPSQNGISGFAAKTQRLSHGRGPRPARGCEHDPPLPAPHSLSGIGRAAGRQDSGALLLRLADRPDRCDQGHQAGGELE